MTSYLGWYFGPDIPLVEPSFTETFKPVHFYMSILRRVVIFLISIAFTSAASLVTYEDITDDSLYSLMVASADIEPRMITAVFPLINRRCHRLAIAARNLAFETSDLFALCLSKNWISMSRKGYSHFDVIWTSKEKSRALLLLLVNACRKKKGHVERIMKLVLTLSEPYFLIFIYLFIETIFNP